MKLSARDQIRELCRLIEEDQFGVVEGCRQIVARLAPLNEADRSSPDLAVIVAVESETDSFPIGAGRAAWSKEALEPLDQERRAYLAKVSTVVKEACGRLRRSLR